MILPSVSKTSTSGPVELEDAVGVGHRSAVQGQRLGSGRWGGEVDEAIAGITPTTIIRLAFKDVEE